LFLLSAPGIVAERWFSIEERVLATSIALFSSIMGISFGYLTSAYIVGDDPDRIPVIIYYSSIWMTIPFIACLLFFKN